MEPKVCPAALLPLISHSFVLSLGGTALLSFGGASRGSLFSDGVVAADVLLGSTMGISSVITRPRGVSIGSYTRGRAFLGWVLAQVRIWSAWSRAFACLFRSGFGRRLLGFHGAYGTRGRGLDLASA